MSAFNEELSPSRKEQGRRRFNIFVVLNTISFTLLGGNFITLYLVRLDATATFIGTVSSFAYLSLFFMVIGRSFTSLLGIVRTFALFWLLRNLVTIPLLISPVLIAAGGRDAGFALIVIGLLGFQVFRGIGVVGNSPVIGALSEGKDRGDYLSLIQILTHSTTIVTGVLSALLLGDQAPLSRYTLFLMVGVAAGVSASLFLLRVPEPPAQTAAAQESLFTSIARANRDVSFRRFLIIFAGTSFLAGMARPFIIVYATDVYAVPDAMILMMVVVGSFGALAMGFMNQMLIDRLGAKPLYNFYLALALLTLLAMLIAPPLSGLFLLGFMGAVFFFFNMAFSGFENSAQSYFYNLVKPEDQLNLGILYFFVMGLGGTLGSLSGGFVLDVASKVFGFGPLGGFRVFFGLMIAGSIPYFIGSLRLASLGSYSFQDALSMIFSLRDLRGILLTRRLDRTRSIGEETRVIQEMAAAPTMVSTELLLERLHSPSYMVRSGALNALENTPPAQNTVRALMTELKLFEYTTAGPAARILGRMGAVEAVPLLRECLHSPDYLLAAESMVALARCGDLSSLPAIRGLFAASVNPLVRIHGTQAMKILADPSSAGIMLDTLARPDTPAYMLDELILALAGLYGLEEWFYPYYQNFLENPRAGVAWLMDHAAQKKPVGPFSYNIEDINQAGLDLRDDIGRFGDFMHHVLLGLELPVRDTGQALRLLSECAKRAELLKQERFRFLLYGLLVRYLPV